MASTRRSASRLLGRIRNTQPQRRLYSNKPESRDHTPRTNARDFDTTIDLAKLGRIRRDGNNRPMRKDGTPMPISEFIWERLRTNVKKPGWWIENLIIVGILVMLPPWEDNLKNREWVDKYGMPRWFLMKSKRQQKEEERRVMEWIKMQKRSEQKPDGSI